MVTDDAKVHHNLLHLRNQGRPGRGTFVHSEIGFNFRMTDTQMAIGLVQLGKLKEARSCRWFQVNTRVPKGRPHLTRDSPDVSAHRLQIETHQPTLFLVHVWHVGLRVVIELAVFGLPPIPPANRLEAHAVQAGGQER